MPILPAPPAALAFRQATLQRIRRAQTTLERLALYEELDGLEGTTPEMDAALEYLKDELVKAILPIISRALVLTAREHPASPPLSSDPRVRQPSLIEDPTQPLRFRFDGACYAQGASRTRDFQIWGEADRVPLEREDQIAPLVAAFGSFMDASHEADLAHLERRRSVLALHREAPTAMTAAYARLEAEIAGQRPLSDDPLQHARRLAIRATTVEADASAAFLAAMTELRQGVVPADDQCAKELQEELTIQISFLRARHATMTGITRRREARAFGLSLADLLVVRHLQRREQSLREFESFLEAALVLFQTPTPDDVTHERERFDTAMRTARETKATIGQFLESLDAPPVSVAWERAGLRRKAPTAPAS